MLKPSEGSWRTIAIHGVARSFEGMVAHYGEPCTCDVQLAVSNVIQGVLTHPRRNVRVREP